MRGCPSGQRVGIGREIPGRAFGARLCRCVGALLGNPSLWYTTRLSGTDVSFALVWRSDMYTFKSKTVVSAWVDGYSVLSRV